MRCCQREYQIPSFPPLFLTSPTLPSLPRCSLSLLSLCHLAVSSSCALSRCLSPYLPHLAIFPIMPSSVRPSFSCPALSFCALLSLSRLSCHRFAIPRCGPSCVAVPFILAFQHQHVTVLPRHLSRHLPGHSAIKSLSSLLHRDPSRLIRITMCLMYLPSHIIVFRPAASHISFVMLALSCLSCLAAPLVCVVSLISVCTLCI